MIAAFAIASGTAHAATLRIVSGFTVNDHVGALAASHDRLHAGTWDAREFYVWTHDGKTLKHVANASGVVYQDIKAIDGELIASGVLPGVQSGAVDWLDPDSLAPRQRLTVGKMQDGSVWTREGMTVRGGQLYLAPSDGQDHQIVLYVFPLESLTDAMFACDTKLSATQACPRKRPPATAETPHAVAAAF